MIVESAKDIRFLLHSHRCSFHVFLQISEVQVLGQSEDMTAKEKLLLWSQKMVNTYPGLQCGNFSTSWRDGRLFNAIIHRHRYGVKTLL